MRGPDNPVLTHHAGCKPCQKLCATGRRGVQHVPRNRGVGERLSSAVDTAVVRDIREDDTLIASGQAALLIQVQLSSLRVGCLESGGRIAVTDIATYVEGKVVPLTNFDTLSSLP